MWLFSETGFISAVAKSPDPNELTVRSRDKASLEALANYCGSQITNTPLADYPYRVVVPNHQFASWVAAEIQAISYSNFKNQVALVRSPRFAKLLGKVWGVMLEAEDSEARRR